MQTQIGTLNVGIDEKRVREIFDEKIAITIKDFSQEAAKIAITRVEEFEERLIPRIAELENGLNSFADPNFQLNLVDAQKSAAGTDRETDYDLLAELLVHRIKKGEERQIRTDIKKAIEIVGDVSDEALVGLTVAYAVGKFTPTLGDITGGLDNLNDMFGMLMDGTLPTGYNWIEHLDLLSAIKSNQFQRLSDILEYYVNDGLRGYVDVGIRVNSAEHKQALEILASNEIPLLGCLVRHSLNPQYLRINIPSKERDKDGPVIILNHEGLRVYDGLPQQKLNAINSIYDLYEDNEEIRMQNIDTFRVEWERRPNLKKLSDWWRTIPIFFYHTSIGGTLAHANAQRCIPDLPTVY